MLELSFLSTNTLIICFCTRSIDAVSSAVLVDTCQPFRNPYLLLLWLDVRLKLKVVRG